MMTVGKKKTHILWQDKKIKQFSLSCGLLSHHTMHCVFTVCIDQISPIGRNTCSTIKQNTPLAPTKQLLKK